MRMHARHSTKEEKEAAQENGDDSRDPSNNGIYCYSEIV